MRFLVPQELAVWLDKRAEAVFKTRARYVRDLLVNLWRKELSDGH